MKRKLFIAFILMLVVVLLVSCGGKKAGKKEEPKKPKATSKEELGEKVPKLVIYSSLPDKNKVSYEMSNELVKELKKLGVDIEAKPTAFAVLMDILYSKDKMDYDFYTIGWSGRIERLDPDMFIHSINHSENAKFGGNNTDRYKNPEFDKVADAQRQEMDPKKRKELVFKAQEILAEDVPRVTLYSRANVQAYNKEKYENVVNIPGEGLFNEWTPLQAKPKTDDKILKIASNINIDSLNPMKSKSVYEWRNLRMIYDKLIRLGEDVKPKPSAAEKWEIKDNKTIEVTLRKGMKFHDGKPVTVQDVKFTFDSFVKNKVAYFASFLAPIDKVEVKGDDVVVFKLKYPYAPFITNTLTQIPILPKHVWEGVSDPINYENKNPIGSGPFKFKLFRPGEELVVEKFADFYNKDIKIDGYIYKIFGTPEGILTALERKEVDLVSNDLIPSHIDQIKKNDGGKYNHLELTNVNDIGFFYMGMNLTRPPMNNKAFRIAVAHLVDYDLALDVHLNGYGSRGGGGLVINSANKNWHNPKALKYNKFDPKKAREILEKAGFTWDKDGKLHMPKK